MTNAYKSGWLIKRGDGAGTEVFTTIEETKSLSGLGKKNELIDATTYDSGNSKEYIAGISDGNELTVTCNEVLGAVQQAGLITDVDAGLTRNFEVVATDGTTTNTYSFAAVCLSYDLQPAENAASDTNKIVFTLKISGDISKATS